MKNKGMAIMSMSETLVVINQMVADGVIANYAICGAVAALNYVEPSATEDLDILISFDGQPKTKLVTLGPIVKYLADKGYEDWKKEGLLIEGWPVQFLPVADDLDREALAEAETIAPSFEAATSIPTRVLSAEHIVATALRTGRPKDYLRIHAFLEEGVLDRDQLRAILRRHGLVTQWATFCQRSGLPDPLIAPSAS
jgi:hypothetical protein